MLRYIVAFIAFHIISCQNNLDVLRANSPECDPPKASSWMQLRDDSKCGTSVCDWPLRWCAISKAPETAFAASMSCIELSPECQAKIKGRLDIKSNPQKGQLDTKSSPQKGRLDNKADPQESYGQQPSPAAGGNGICRDFAPDCATKVSQGMCQTEKGYMRAMCPMACGRC